MSSGEQQLRAHLESGRFQAGSANGRWRLIELAWPHAFVEVCASDGRRFVLRFDCTGYPGNAPTATLWNTETDCLLEARFWPRGGRVSQVFNFRWKAGSALYIPCDRQAIEGHGGWIGEYPWLVWNPNQGVLQYIEAVWEVLQSKELERDAA